MSDHNNDHAHDNPAYGENHADNHHGSDRPYFDDSTSILTPVYIAIALIVIFITLFSS